MSAILDGTGHPARFGYVRCSWCGCWRPRAETLGSDSGPDTTRCTDGMWCVRQVTEPAPFLPHAGSPVVAQNALQSPETARPATTGLDSNGDAE